VSLLLDALRRAAASKQDPEDDQYVAPRRENSSLEPDEEPTADHEAGGAPERPAPDSGSAETDFELSLEPETDGPDQPSGRSGGDAVTEHVTSEPEPEPEPERPAAAAASRPAATTLLHARGGGSRRHRGRGVLIGIALLVVIAFALAAGGWLYYLQSRQAVDRDLAAYRPTAEPLVKLETDGQIQSTTGAEAADDEADVGAGAEDTDAAAVGGDSVGAEDPAAAVDEAGVAEAEVAAAEPAGGQETESSGTTPVSTGTAAGTADDADTTEAAQARSDTADTASASAAGSADKGAGEARASGSGGSATPKRQVQPMVQTTATGPSVLSKALNAGYAALRAGDLVTARREYRRALSRDFDNRDALLGLASVAQRRGEPERAASYYQRVLEDQPRDPYARAGLASLAGRIEPRRSETELKRLLRDQPDSPSLHFALGNVYAGESRWAEAQQAYFSAYRAEADNPEYAYNLAVALDHLEKRQAALEHYRAALAGLDGGAGAGFSAEAVRRRIAQLE